MGKHIEGGRKEFFGMKASADELDLMKRCASHAGCSAADLVRWLFIEYAHVNGLPVRPGAPLAPNPEELCKALGLPASAGVAYRMPDREDLAAHVDPDRFFMDDRISSTTEALPAPESFDPSVAR